MGWRVLPEPVAIIDHWRDKIQLVIIVDIACIVIPGDDVKLRARVDQLEAVADLAAHFGLSGI